MKIAVFHDQPSGGARRALHGFCRALAARGHRIDFFTLTTADTEMLRDEDVASSVTVLPFAFRPSVRRGLYLNDIRRRQSFADLERVNAHAARLIDAGQYDVALVDACRFTFAPRVLRHLHTPSAYFCHHRPARLFEHHFSPPVSAYERARQLCHWPLEHDLERRLWEDDRRLVRLADRVITNSSFTRDLIREVYGVDAAICTYGVELPPDAHIARKDYVLSVGELEVRKGFDFVVDSLATLPVPPPLHIVANGANARVREALEVQARRLGVNLTIRIMPPQSELAREYREAAAFVYGAREEALGLAALEAMASRTPVVAVAEGGVRETVQDGVNGYLVARDTRRFGARLGELLSSRGLRDRMGAAGRAAIEERWTWPLRARALERELLALARPAPVEQSV